MKMERRGEPFPGARVVLGVAGDLSACESPALCSRLVQLGAQVDVVLCEGADRFIQPLTFQALTHRRVYTSMFELREGANIPHVALAGSADLIVVAPATDPALARLANGLADDLIYAIALGTSAPLLLAASAAPDVWQHPATQRNVEALEKRGARVLAPATDATKRGSMTSTEAIVAAAGAALESSGATQQA